MSGVVALGTKAYVSVHRSVTSTEVTQHVPAVLGLRKYSASLAWPGQLQGILGPVSSALNWFQLGDSRRLSK